MTADRSTSHALPQISVVIPTHNRSRILARTLEALANQRSDGAGDARDGQWNETFEVIVADDGSRDDTAAVLEAERARGRLALRSFSQEQRGPARARNQALALARAPRALLLGDDTVPAPDLIARHRQAAAISADGQTAGPGGELGIQGYIEWHPEIPLSPVMEFLAPAGPQFYFAGLEDERPVPWAAILGANFSAPTRWFREDPFDESFRHAAFEDTELAYRWALKGRQSIFRRSAVCYHDHSYETIEPFLRRQRVAGRSARLAVRKHPRIFAQTVLQPAVIGVAIAARHAARILLRRRRQNDAWDLRTRFAFLRGFLEG
jgi:glycosyltransferase involved in cell wall biosynthesis